MLLPQNLNRVFKKGKENARVRWLPYHMSWWGGGQGSQAHRLAQGIGMLTDVSLGRLTHSPTPGQSVLFHWIGPYFSLKFTLTTISLAKKIRRWQQQMIFCLHDNALPLVARVTLKQQSRGWFRDTVLLRLLLKWGSGSSLLHTASLQGLSNNILCFVGFFNILILWSMGQW